MHNIFQRITFKLAFLSTNLEQHATVCFSSHTRPPQMVFKSRLYPLDRTQFPICSPFWHSANQNLLTVVPNWHSPHYFSWQGWNCGVALGLKGSAVAEEPGTLHCYCPVRSSKCVGANHAAPDSKASHKNVFYLIRFESSVYSHAWKETHSLDTDAVQLKMLLTFKTGCKGQNNS